MSFIKVPQHVHGNAHCKWYQRVSVADTFLNIDIFTGDSCHENSGSTLVTCPSFVFCLAPRCNSHSMEINREPSCFISLSSWRERRTAQNSWARTVSFILHRVISFWMLVLCVLCFWVCKCLSIKSQRLWCVRADWSPQRMDKPIEN